MMATPQAAGPLPNERLRAAVIALARQGSIEATAKRPEEAAAWARLVSPETDVYVAWVPGTPPPQLAQVAARIRAAGRNPVPHIAARQISSPAAAAELLARLHGEAQVTQVLLIAGDVATPAGPFASTLALLESGLLPEHGIRAVGVAGYPEGHPAIPDPDLLAALRAKIKAAAAQGLELTVVSQFCFDGAALLTWLRWLRAERIAAPVRVGLAGPATVRTLLNYGIRCGVGNSLRALGTHGQTLAKLLTQQGPEAVVAALAPQAEALVAGVSGKPTPLGVSGLHLFSFGGFPRSAQWLTAVREGRFQLGEGGFRVG
jgi:methylenetetrahydrofolate reductase (NADPH)